MTKYIHKNTLDSHISTSGKAIYFTIRFGTSSIHDRTIWMPMSQLSIGEFNECGWAKIDIPNWLINKNGLQKANFVELEEA